MYLSEKILQFQVNTDWVTYKSNPILTLSTWGQRQTHRIKGSGLQDRTLFQMPIASPVLLVTCASGWL